MSHMGQKATWRHSQARFALNPESGHPGASRAHALALRALATGGHKPADNRRHEQREPDPEQRPAVRCISKERSE